MMHARTPARRLDGVARCGSLLVVALVLALPLTLAFCPADTLGSSDGASGVGAGTGDEIAAALSSLDRDLHGGRVLPEPARLDGPHLAPFGALAPLDTTADAFDAHAPPPLGSRDDTPGNASTGPAGLGHQLRL